MGEFQGLNTEECKKEDFTVRPVTLALYCTVLYSTCCTAQDSTVLYNTGRGTSEVIYFSAAHILSRKGLNSMNPSSFSGSQSSFINALASSLVSFSPRFVRRRKVHFQSWC